MVLKWNREKEAGGWGGYNGQALNVICPDMLLAFFSKPQGKLLKAHLSCKTVASQTANSSIFIKTHEGKNWPISRRLASPWTSLHDSRIHLWGWGGYLNIKMLSWMLMSGKPQSWVWHACTLEVYGEAFFWAEGSYNLLEYWDKVGLKSPEVYLSGC